MIYLADQWPEPYRGKLFTLNFHGRRVNVERLERAGSGYVGRHEPDIFFAADPWFRGIDLGYGPDGGVFVLDWSDTGECHEHDGVHRTSGRIYRITYGEPARADGRDVSKLSERELVALHRHANEWFVRQARRVLADRSARGEPLAEAKAGPSRRCSSRTPTRLRKIRALCSLYVIGAADDRVPARAAPPRARIGPRLGGPVPDRRPADRHDLQPARRATTSTLPADLLREFAATSPECDRSGLVRLVLASTLQRLPVSQRVELAAALVSRSEDTADHKSRP